MFEFIIQLNLDYSAIQNLLQQQRCRGGDSEDTKKTLLIKFKCHPLLRKFIWPFFYVHQALTLCIKNIYYNNKINITQIQEFHRNMKNLIPILIIKPNSWPGPIAHPCMQIKELEIYWISQINPFPEDNPPSISPRVRLAVRIKG